MLKHKYDIIILFCFLIVSGMLSIYFGQDGGWDLSNYHMYAPYALLHNKIGVDIFPARVQSYFNPLADIPYYYMSIYFKNFPQLIAFILGLPYGFAVFGVYKISELLFLKSGIEKILLIFFCIIIGATGQFGLMEVGMTNNDISTSVFVIYALYLLLKYLFQTDSQKRSLAIFVAGFLLGIGTGLKLTCGIFTVSEFLVLLLLFKKYESPAKILSYNMLGIMTGFILFDGYWMYLMWIKFQNPLFPHFNNIFKSPLVPFQSFCDPRYKPTNILQWIFYPLYWNYPEALNRTDYPFSYVFEGIYKDYRYPMIYISILITLFSTLLYKFSNTFKKIFNEIDEYFDRNKTLFILLFTIISYVIWLCAFSILRYFMPIEFLSGVIIMIAIIYIKQLFSRVFKIKLFSNLGLLSFIVAVFLLTSTLYRPFERVPFKVVHFEDFKLPDNAIVLILGNYPSSAWAVSQNPKARFINIYHAENYFEYPFILSNTIKTKVKNLIRENSHKVYILYTYNTFPLSARSTASINPVKEYVNMNKFRCHKCSSTFGRYDSDIHSIFCSPLKGGNL